LAQWCGGGAIATLPGILSGDPGWLAHVPCNLPPINVLTGDLLPLSFAPCALA
jgi:hypothetical protein